jgi:chromosome segregation ATPase
METSKFGSSFLNFLALQSATSDTDISNVQHTINEYLDTLQEHQADDDARHNANQAICDELISALTTQVHAELATVESLKNAIETNTEILEGAKRDLNLAASDYDETVSSLESGQAQREAEHARWVDIDYEHENAETQLDESIKLIKHLIHGVTFAQIKPRFEKVQENLRKSAKFGTLFKPLILSLSELATKLNYENVVAIIDLLNNILGSVRQSRADYQRTEDIQQADWDALSTHLTDQKNSLSDKKSRLNALITATDEIIIQSAASLEFHNNQLVRLQEALAEQENWCETVFGIYDSNTLERNRQTDILTRLNGHIEERYGSVAEYLQTRQLTF